MKGKIKQEKNKAAEAALLKILSYQPKKPVSCP